MALITQPSRKPGFWAEVDRLKRADGKAAKKTHTEEIVDSHAARVKRSSTSVKPAVKNAKPPGAKGGKTRR